MAIENLELSRIDSLPAGITAEYSDEFGGDLVIRRDGEIAGISFGQLNERSVFKEVFREQGVEIFNAWKQDQLDSKGGES